MCFCGIDPNVGFHFGYGNFHPLRVPSGILFGLDDKMSCEGVKLIHRPSYKRASRVELLSHVATLSQT